MKNRMLKQIKSLRRDVARNWYEILRIENQIILVRKEIVQCNVDKMQSSAREMLIMSREL